MNMHHHPLSNRTLKASIAGVLMIGLIFPPSLPVQAATTPPAETTKPAANLFTAAQLDKMLGPIALYPDPLLAQILPAATVPHDVVMAWRYVSAKKDPAKIDQQPWHVSVKAIARYPDVLKMMDEKLDWTTELGKAYLAQPDDVFASVQNLRSQAKAIGNLNDTPQQVIVVEKEVIKIMPANPQVIYVPTYTTVVYTTPYNPAAPIIAFGAGLAIGAWLANDNDVYWYGRGAYYHGGHHGNYYGGNNTINVNNSTNINVSGNNVGNGSGNNIGNGNRPNGGNNNIGNANRPATRPATTQPRPYNSNPSPSTHNREASKPVQQSGSGGRFGGGEGGNGGKFSNASRSGGGASRGGNGGGANRGNR